MKRRKIMTVIATASLAVTLITVPVTNAMATGEGVDMTQACRLQYGPTWAAKLFYPNQGAYGWKCWIPPFGTNQKDVDVNNYCQVYYNEWAYNTGGAYSWYCA